LPTTVSVPVAGGQIVRLQRNGSAFREAENERVAIADTRLQAVNFDGSYYVRWTFTVRPKQVTEFRSIRVEDVTGATPMLLVNDIAPQQDAGKWTGNAGLMELSSTSLQWFFDNSESVRTFRFTISEVDGRGYVLYQGALYGPNAKVAIWKSIGR
jgi:hypothetical protein